MIEKKLSLILRVILYSAFAVILSGIVVFSFTGRGKIVFEFGILMILLTPLAEFLTILIHGLRERKTRFVLLSLWLLTVFMLSLLRL